MEESIAPQPQPDEKLVKVFDTEQETEAILVQGLLESAGIESDLKSIDVVQDTFPGIGGTMLLVREIDEAEAKRVIESRRQLPPLGNEPAEYRDDLRLLYECDQAGRIPGRSVEGIEPSLALSLPPALMRSSGRSRKPTSMPSNGSPTRASLPTAARLRLPRQLSTLSMTTI